MAIDIEVNGDGTFTASSSVPEEIVLDLVEETALITSSGVTELPGGVYKIFGGVPGRIVWDNVGDRRYEFGVDRGVLYLEDGTAIPWNGLTSIIEKSEKERTAVYYDGSKINELVSVGDFSAIMSALTYPDEFLSVEGIAEVEEGIYLGDQPLQLFNLCYRTQIGNDVDGSFAGYKIHILYNVIAIPSDQTYSSLSDSPNLTEFQWNIYCIPEEVVGYRPTAHVIINSLDTDTDLLEDLENMFYGDETTVPSLPSMSDLLEYISSWTP